MKNSTYRNKNILLILLSALCAFLCGFAFMLMPRQKAFAQGTSPSFGLTEGASIRVPDGNTEYKELGIRYQFSTDKDSYETYKAQNAQFGILILPEDIITEGREINAATVFGIGGMQIYSWAEWNGSEWAYTAVPGRTRIANYYTDTLELDKDGNYSFCGSLVNLKENNLLREFRGYAYVKIGDNVTFATDDSNLRSMIYVAQRAVEVPANADKVEVLEGSYLDKVADRNSTYTVRHHKIALNGTDSVEEETFTAALGLEVGGKQKEIAGYAFDESNAASKLSGTVYANGKLVLEYYYNEIPYTTISTQVFALSMTDSTETVADGFDTVKTVTTTWNKYNFNSMDLTPYTEVKFAVKSAGYYGVMTDGSTVVGETSNSGNWLTISLVKNGANWDLYYGSEYKQSLTLANNNLTDLYFRFGSNTYYVTELKGIVAPSKVVTYVNAADQLITTSGNGTVADVTGTVEAPAGATKVYSLTASGFTFAKLNSVLLDDYVALKFYIQKGTDGTLYHSTSGNWDDRKYELTAEEWAEVTLTKNGEGTYDVAVSGAKEINAYAPIASLNEIAISASNGVCYVSNLMGVLDPAKVVTYVDVADEVFALSMTDSTETVADGFDTVKTVTTTWNKYNFNSMDLTPYTEVKFAVKSAGYYGVMTGDTVVGETNNSGNWLTISLVKNGANWDLYYGSEYQQSLTLANNNLTDLYFRFGSNTYYVTELKGAIDPAHTHVYKTVVLKNATCTADGEKVQVCTLCGETTAVEAITTRPTHVYMSATIAANCKLEGSKTRTCTYCGDVQVESIAKLDHDFVEKTVLEATKYEEGLKQTLCSACGTVGSSTPLPATGLGVSYTVNVIPGGEQTIKLSVANVLPSIIDSNGNETGYANPFWNGPLVEETLNEKACLSNSVAQATVDGTATTWRYFRNVINVDFTEYEEVSFDIAISVSRTSAFDVKIGGVAIRITDNKTWKNVRVLQDGSVYFEGTLVTGAKVTGNRIVIDVDTLTTQTEQNYSSFYIGTTLTVIAQEKTTRDVTLVKGGNISVVALDEIGGTTTYAHTGTSLSTGAHSWSDCFCDDEQCLTTDAVTRGDNVACQYFRYTVNIDYRKLGSVTILLGANTLSKGFDIIVGGKTIAIPVAKVWHELTVKTDGSVYFNGTLVEGATMTNGEIVFEIDSHLSSYGTFHINHAQIELGDFVGLEEQDLVLTKDSFSQAIIDESGNVVDGAANKDNFWDTPNGLDGYRMYLSNSTTSGADYYRYFRAIIDLDFKQYESVSFQFAINQVQEGGVGFNVTLGGVKHNLTEAGTYTVKITQDGSVWLDGNLLAGAKMTGNQIVMDLDTCATASNYRCIDVYKTFKVVPLPATEISLVKNNATNYAIVYDADNKEVAFAANELAKYFKEGTGVALNTSLYSGVGSVGERSIVLGVAPAADKGLSFVGLKTSDYVIAADELNIYIYSPSGYGVINGVYALLDELFGLEIYYKGVYTLTGSQEDISLPLQYKLEGNRTFAQMWAGTGELTPSESNGYSQEYGYNLGMITNYYMQNVSTTGWHNATTMIDYATYGAAHDDWFYKENGEVKQLYLAVEDFSAAEGSLVYTVAEKIWAEMSAETMPQRTITCMFSQMDNGVWANGSNYPKSQALLEKYGTHAAENIMFTNAVAKLIDEKLAQNNPYGQPIIMQMLSYHRGLVAPNLEGLTEAEKAAVQLYKGTNVKVVPYVAPVEVNYYMAFTDSRNVVRNPLTGEFDSGSPTAAQAIESWCALTDEIHLWMYSLDATNYFMPVDILTNMQANYKFAAEHGVTVIMDQNQYNENGGMTDWARLKNYIRGVLAKDVNADVDTAIADFMKAYFGAGATKMQMLLETQQTWYEKLVAQSNVASGDGDPRYYAGNLYGWQSLNKKWCFTENPEKPSINLGQGDATFVKSWMTLIEEAKAAIDGDATLTAEQKAELCKRVDLESLTARFILIEIYGDKTYDNSTSAFYAFAKECGMTQSGENGAL